MLNLLLLGTGIIILLFGSVVLFGAPYLPTRKKQINEALDILALNPGQTMLELGCGDGRVLKVAAMQGIKAVGYELNPLLFLVALVSTWPERKNVKVIYGNFWHKTWQPADGIFVFLHPRFMAKLNAKIMAEAAKPVKLVSYAFEIPGKTPGKQGNGLFLYSYK